MTNFARFAIAAAAVLIVAVVGIGLLSRPGGSVGPGATATASPTQAPSPSPGPTASPAALPGAAPLRAGSYFMTPFAGEDSSPCGPAPTGPTPCPDGTRDDSIRVSFSVPDGWAAAPFESVWLSGEAASPPAGGGMIFGRGGWLHSEPCLTDASGGPDVPVGPTVDDFTNALAEHPLLDVTAPVDVTLGGYSGTYVDLQVPSDISACNAYFPWEGGRGLFAQGNGHRWHLWIIDVDGVRVVVQTGDYAGTAPQRQAELRAIVDSIRITP